MEDQNNKNLDEQPVESSGFGESPGVWVRYKWWIVLVLGIGVLILVLVLALLAGRSRWEPDHLLSSNMPLGEDVGVQPIQGRIYLASNEDRVGVGDQFMVKILADTGNRNAAAVSLQIAYNPDRLEIVNIDGSGSVFSISAIKKIEPEYVEIVRGEPGDGYPGDEDDGFTGQGGTVVTLVVKAKTAGGAELNFLTEKTKMILDDGKGTEMEIEMEGGEYVIEKLRAILKYEV